MRYLLLLHIDESAWPELTPDQQREGMAAYGQFNQALSSARALVDNGRLSASSAGAMVRTKGGRAVVMDGPFAETKEQVAGYYIIEAPDMAAALDWAGRCPAAGYGAVEVRALADGPQA